MKKRKERERNRVSGVSEMGGRGNRGFFRKMDGGDEV